MNFFLPPDLKTIREGTCIFRGALLLTDISGFTGLTGRLARHGKKGTEELSDILNSFFSAMHGIVWEYGGSVLSSAGDSMLASFPEGPGPDRCAAEIMEAMQGFRGLKTSAGPFRLGIKTVLGYGPWGRFIMGDARGAHLYLAGDLVARMAHAESSASEGDLVSVVSDMEPGIPPSPLEGILDEAFLIHGEGGTPGEHRSVSAIFVNVTGYDPARPPVARLREVYGRIADAAAKYSGTVHSIDNMLPGGCRILVLFGAPVSHGDDHVHAVASAIEMRDRTSGSPDLDIHIGMDEGYAFAGVIGSSRRKHYTVIGEVVNSAAGIADLAATGELLVSDRVRRMTRNDFVFSGMGTVEIRGRDRPQQVHTPVSRRSDRVYSYGFVGREPETERILAGMGSGSYFGLVEGEAGIGKTRFLDRLSGILSSRGITCHHASAGERGLSNGILASLVEDMSGMADGDTQAVRKSRLCYLVNELEDSSGALSHREPFIGSMLFSLDYPDSDHHRLPPALRRENLLDGVCDLVLAFSGHSCIILEDLHNCGEEDLEAVGYICRRILERRRTGISILLSRRPDARELPGTGDHIPDRVLLSSLEDGALGGLAMEILGSRPLEDELDKVIRNRAGGNPFYLMQFLLYLVEEGLISPVDGVWSRTDAYSDEKLPENIFTMIMARIDRLEKQAKESLRIGSVIGLRFDEETVRRVAGRDVSSSLGQCLAAGLTCRSDLRALEFVFSHTLIKDVTYDSILRKRRRDIHGSIASILEEVHRDDLGTVSPLLAHHFRVAESWDSAVRYSILAGSKACSDYRNHDAIGHYTSALEMMKSHPEETPDQLAESLLELGRIYDRLGRYDEAGDYYGASLSAAVRGTSPRDAGFLAEVRLLRADIAYTTGRVEESLAELDDIESMLEASGENHDLLMVRIECFRSWAYCVTGRTGPAMEKALKALELAEGLKGVPDREKDHRRGFAYNTLATVHWGNGDYERAREYYQRALAIAREQDMKREMAVTSGNIGLVSQKLDDLHAAVAAFEMQKSLSEQIGEKLILLSSYGSISSACGTLGDLGGSMDAACTYLRLAMELPAMQDILLAHCQMGILQLAFGNMLQAGIHADSILDMPGAEAYERERASAFILKGMLRMEMDDPAGAGELFGRGEELCRRVQSRSQLLNALTARMYLCSVTGDAEGAAGIVEEAGELLEEMGMASGAGRIHVLRSRMLDLEGKTEAAVEETGSAIDVFREKGLRPALADALHFLCSLRGSENGAGAGETLDALERELGVTARRSSAVLQIL
ncbi:MAG: hypothetical protein AVO35_09445 [Candidatus Aegiribacteria sp. MLS_C]|nr:MAG: hypothetical protein AVO35_09445 [Candidatus Aegiribacteria sp. MLS_C]